MWILKWLPDWIFYAMFFMGIAGLITSWVLDYIPFVNTYNLPIKVVSIVLVVIGTYMAGAISNETAWLARVKDLEYKIAQAEIKSAESNTKIVEKIVTKTEIIREKGKEVTQYIDREVVKYDTQCVIPKEFVKAVNDAAKGAK